VIDEAVGKDLEVIRGPMPAPLWGTPPGATGDQ
jgi:hypothetical protein